MFDCSEGDDACGVLSYILGLHCVETDVIISFGTSVTLFRTELIRVYLHSLVCVGLNL